jgi:hypothetical protein
MDVTVLLVTLTILNQPVVYFWIYQCEWKQKTFYGCCTYCKWTHQIHSDHEPGVRLFCLGSRRPYFLFRWTFFVTWHTWKLEHKQSIFNILLKTRPIHATVFLIVFSVPNELNIHRSRIVIFVLRIEESRSCSL